MPLPYTHLVLTGRYVRAVSVGGVVFFSVADSLVHKRLVELSAGNTIAVFDIVGRKQLKTAAGLDFML